MNMRYCSKPAFRSIPLYASSGGGDRRSIRASADAGGRAARCGLHLRAKNSTPARTHQGGRRRELEVIANLAARQPMVPDVGGGDVVPGLLQQGRDRAVARARLEEGM